MYEWHIIFLQNTFILQNFILHHRIPLKRKLIYNGYVYFEPIRPQIVAELLDFLKINNPLYDNVTVDLNQISDELLYLNDEEMDAGSSVSPSLEINAENKEQENISDFLSEITEEIEENILDAHRTASNETIMASKIPMQIDKDAVTVAPGEGKKPLAIYNDEKCEEMAFPHLFPTGKFGYKYERDIKISPVKYFNQRLLNHTQNFASDTDYIFFANHVMQQTNLRNRINIAMKKMSGNNLTAGMFSQNFKETVKTFIANDEAFNFMSTMKGTPAYWKKFLLEVLAIVKQFGVPPFFFTLSSADLRWFELPYILSKLYNINLSDAEINDMSYEDRCRYLNMNPVFTARHFQYRFETFFKEIIVNSPLGKVKYHVVRVEFQVRGSPNVDIFIWVTNPVILKENNKEEYIAFVDGIIRADLPDKN